MNPLRPNGFQGPLGLDATRLLSLQSGAGHQRRAVGPRRSLRGDRTTGRPDLDRLLAWKDSPFRVGLLVTNTTFSKDARWLADQVHNKAFIRLRGFEDLKRWLSGQFDSEFDWREIPDVITLAPGITITVPKARLTNSRDIWPLSDVKMLDELPEEN